MPIFYHCIVLISLVCIICQSFFILFFEYQVILNYCNSYGHKLLWPFHLSSACVYKRLSSWLNLHVTLMCQQIHKCTYRNISNRNLGYRYLHKETPAQPVCYSPYCKVRQQNWVLKCQSLVLSAESLFVEPNCISNL